MFPVPAKYRSEPVDKTLKWYTLCVSSRLFQTRVFSFLEGYAVWIPDKKVAVYSGDDCYTEHEPLYPGYVFVGLTTEQGIARLEKAAKRYNPSFNFLRTMGNAYHCMTLTDIEVMLSALVKHNASSVERLFKRGEKVKIKAGPLSGNIGVIKKYSPGRLTIKAVLHGKELEMQVRRDSFVFLERYDQD